MTGTWSNPSIVVFMVLLAGTLYVSSAVQVPIESAGYVFDSANPVGYASTYQYNLITTAPLGFFRSNSKNPLVALPKFPWTRIDITSPREYSLGNPTLKTHDPTGPVSRLPADTEPEKERADKTNKSVTIIGTRIRIFFRSLILSHSGG